MPTIDWKNLPKPVRKHLEDRARTRMLSVDDIVRLMEWILRNPEVPDGRWCKDFGSFKLVGEGSVPKTFLEADQPCFGTQLA